MPPSPLPCPGSPNTGSSGVAVSGAEAASPASDEPSSDAAGPLSGLWGGQKGPRAAFRGAE